MRITAAQMLPQIQENVSDSGICIDNPAGMIRAVRALNMACKAFHVRIDDDGTLWNWGVPVYENCFALPEDCLEIRQCWINGTTATQHDQWYQGKIACGMNDPGSVRYGPEVIDLGFFPIPTPLPKIKGIRLGFMAQSDADAGKTVDLIILNEYGESVRELLVLPAKQQIVLTESVVYDVTFLQKEKTQDNVKLYQCYENGQKFFIVDYTPKTILGAFRRKKVPQCYFGCKFITIKGKRKYIEIEEPTDICPFDNPIALSWGVSAIAALRRQDAVQYQALLQTGLNELYKQMRDSDSPSNVAQARFRSGNANASQAGNLPMPGTSMYGRGRGGGIYW